MGAIGKYIDGSGTETILAASKAYCENVVRSVMDGSHYTRSLALLGPNSSHHSYPNRQIPGRDELQSEGQWC